jgi:hypothetical protein
MNPIDSTIEALIITGAIEIVGIDPKTEEPLYKFNQSIQEIMPDLYREHINEVNRDIMRLWENGFLEIDFMSDDPIVTLTDKAFIDEEIEKISKELQSSLSEIKRLLVK